MPDRLVFLLGRTLRHSVSPAFQNAAFHALGLPFTYRAWPIEPEQIADVVARLRERDCAGANVTVPYKAEAARMVDDADETARMLEAVNTVVNHDGRLAGYNTDVEGFARALADGGIDVGGRRAVVLGAGGAARAVVLALHRGGVREVMVANRTLARAERLVRELNRRAGLRAHAMPWDRAPGALTRAELLVNCTSVGMRHGPDEGRSPIDTALLPPGLAVCDIVANPLETPLLAGARRRGCATLGGLPMLVHQGALSFEYWTGQAAPLDVMFAAARAAMEALPDLSV